jgi:hypothetical protein
VCGLCCFFYFTLFLHEISCLKTNNLFLLLPLKHVGGGGGRNACITLVGKPQGRKPLGRHRRRWEDNIKIDLREVGWLAWTGSILLRVRIGCRECGDEPLGSIKCEEFLTSWEYISFTASTLALGISYILLLHACNQELHDFYSFPNFTRWRRQGWGMWNLRGLREVHTGCMDISRKDSTCKTLA